MLEKHVHDFLMTYLTSHKLLHSKQSGFRPNHSCETALLQMVNNFLEAINSSQIIGMVMVDFRKAFDLVDHTLLLKKLRHYKLSDKTINWYSSYLLGRKQKVVKNGECFVWCTSRVNLGSIVISNVYKRSTTLY